jgi:hypothetical protein
LRLFIQVDRRISVQASIRVYHGPAKVLNLRAEERSREGIANVEVRSLDPGLVPLDLQFH